MKPRGCTDCSCPMPRSDGTDEGPSADDIAAFSDPTRPCPSCGAQLHDDVSLCWKCGHAVEESDDAKGPPAWVVITGIALAVILGVMLMR